MDKLQQNPMYINGNALRVHPDTLAAFMLKSAPLFDHEEVVESIDVYPEEMFRIVRLPSGLLVDATHTADAESYIGGKVVPSIGFELEQIVEGKCEPVSVWVDTDLRLEEASKLIAKLYGISLGESAIKIALCGGVDELEDEA